MSEEDLSSSMTSLDSFEEQIDEVETQVRGIIDMSSINKKDFFFNFHCDFAYKQLFSEEIKQKCFFDNKFD